MTTFNVICVAIAACVAVAAILAQSCLVILAWLDRGQRDPREETPEELVISVDTHCRLCSARKATVRIWGGAQWRATISCQGCLDTASCQADTRDDALRNVVAFRNSHTLP